MATDHNFKVKNGLHVLGSEGVYLTDTNTRLHEGNGNALRITTGTGYVDLGSMNSSWVHFQANKNIYILPSTHVSVDGHLYPYTDSTRTLGGNTVRWSHTYTDNITVTDDVTIGGTITSGKIEGTTANANGHILKTDSSTASASDVALQIRNSSADYNLKFQPRLPAGNMHSGVNADDFGIFTSNSKGISIGNNDKSLVIIHPTEGIELHTNNVRRFNIDTSGNIQINGTTIIDTSRNLSNIGTISSSAITSTDYISAGETTGTGGGLVLAQRYAGDDHIATISTMYSNGGWVLGYGAKAKNGASGFVSTFDNFSAARAYLRIQNTAVAIGYAPAQQTAVDSDLTSQSENFVFIPSTGNLSIAGTLTSVNVNTGQGATEVHLMNQNVRTTDSPTFDELTVTDFIKASGNNLKFSAGGTHVLNIDLNNHVYPQTHNVTDVGFSSSLAFKDAFFSGVGNFGTINTGQGATEVHLMNQNVRSSDSPTFADLTVTGNLNITGDINSYNVTDLDVVDKTITLGVGGTSSANNNGGIIVDGANAKLIWSDTAARWTMNKSLQFSDTPTTTNQAMGIFFPGFDKESTGDYTDNAKIIHTTNTGGHAGSVLLIESQNDANDGIAFITNASSRLKHNSNNIFTDAYHPNADTLTTARTIAGTSFDGSANIDISYDNLTNKPSDISNSDTVDGLHAASFLRSDAEDLYSPTRLDFGSSGGWDAVGFSNLTNLHMRDHNQFWIGAGNGTWFTGTANSKSSTSGLAADASKAHDLLITTMQGTSTYDRGITFAVDSGGAGNSGYRLGKWHSSNEQHSSKLTIDGGLHVRGGDMANYDYYANDYSTYWDDNSGGAYWPGDTGWIDPSITAGNALQIQAGNAATNSNNPALQFHQYGYGGIQLRYDGPNDVMHLESTGSDRFDYFQVKTDHGNIQIGPMNTSHAHIYTDRGNFYFNKTVLYANSTNNLIWHGGNDGSGSGLDADLLDGYHGDRYHRSALSTFTSGNWNNLTTHGTVKIQHSNFNSDTNPPPASYAYGIAETLEAEVGGENRTLQIYYPHSNNDRAHYIRMFNSSSWTAWRTVPHTVSGAQTVWHSNNDGAGSGLDADTVDGIQGGSFLRSDADDTVTAGTTYTWSATNTEGLVFENSSYNKKLYIGGWSSSNSAGISRIRNSNDNLHLDSGSAGNLYLNHYSGGTVYARQNVVWHAGNDGSGSGLDADLLDGQHGSYYLPTNTTRAGITNSAWAGGSGYPGYTFSGGNSRFGFSSTAGVVDVYIDGNYYATDSSHLVWHAGNDGSGSGLDADLLDSLQASQFLRSDANDTFGSTSANQKIRFNCNSGQYIASGGSETRFPIEVFSPTANGGDAAISFHISGDYAGYFGLASDWNDLAWGGWSVGSSTKYRIWHSGNDGSGSGLDADLLDGTHLSAIYSNSAVANTSVTKLYENATITYGGSYLQWMDQSGTGGTGQNSANPGNPFNDWHHHIIMNHGNSNGYYVDQAFSFHHNRVHFRRLAGNNSPTSWYEFWHTGNDGSGSGLDADTLDGIQASGFGLVGGGTSYRPVTAGLYGTGHSSSILPIWQYNSANPGYGIGYYEGNPDIIKFDVSGHLMSSTCDFEITPNVAKVNGGTVWHSGNDGSGSGLDADTLDGVQLSNIARTDTAEVFGGAVTVNGNLTPNGGINLERSNNNGTGISFYDNSYYNWQIYMASAGQTSQGANANLTAPSGLAGVTSWALRSRMEGIATYGWIWETGGTGGGGATATAKMSLQATTGNLQLAGSLTAGADVVAYSDEKLKDNVQVIENAVEKVKQVRGVTFTRNDLEDQKRHAGVIAQEVEKILPEVVGYDEDRDTKTVAYGNMVGLLIEAIKEQQETIDKLTRRINDIEEKGE